MATSNCADALSLIFSPSFSSNTASKLPHIRKFSQNNLCLHYHNTLSSVLRKKNATAARVSATMAANVVKEVLPPALDSTSEPPPLFDGTTRLYISYTCPYAQRVWITRNCKGLQEKIKLVPIDLQNRPDWYKKKVYLANKDPNKREFAEELFSYTDTFNKTARSSLEGDGNEARAAFHYFETPLSKFNDGPFLQGQFSLADIAYAPFIERCKPFLLEAKKYDITAGRPQLATWIEEMKNEAFNQTYKKRFVVFPIYYIVK